MNLIWNLTAAFTMVLTFWMDRYNDKHEVIEPIWFKVILFSAITLLGISATINFVKG